MATTKKTALRPCPFCGLSNAWIKRAEVTPGQIGWKVRCACGASIAWYDKRKSAVDVWNGVKIKLLKTKGAAK